MPVGLGKSTLSRWFSRYLIELDTITDAVRGFSKLRSECINTQNWDRLNSRIKYILSRYDFQGRILLVNHPAQVPSKGFKIVAILNAETLNMRSVMRDSYTRFKIGLINRESLRVYKGSETYRLVESNNEVLSLVMSIIDARKFQKKVSYRGKEWFFNRYEARKAGMRFLRLAYHYKYHYCIDVRDSHLCRVYLPVMVMQKKLRIGNEIDKGLRFSDLIRKVVHLEGSHISSTIGENFLEYNNKLDESLFNINFSQHHLYSILGTKACQGGFGLDISLLINNTKLSEVSIGEEIITPKVTNPYSPVIDRAVNRCIEKFGYRPNLQALYASSYSTNKSLKPLGYIFTKYVQRKSSNGKRVVLLVNANEVMEVLTGVDVNVLYEYPTPVLRNEFVMDTVMTEAVMSYVRSLHFDQRNLYLLWHIFSNSELIETMFRVTSNGVFMDWLLGRLEIRKPLRLRLSNNIVSIVYRLYLIRLFRLAMATGHIVTYDTIKLHCNMIEETLLPRIEGELDQRGLHIWI
jgi:hypothetical protein